ncbi:Cytochrome c556 [Andreprevotia lacus DSM 23236]|jgi:cytochrome c556|uniref:Cytochrome c556 n=1 Tax=Andreprevotia lacus DSM 23236 TaxID=1121001 RepID=A0A1W1X614_9NEIS|nr:cytochrome c [Andreprevotia lacus]SMC19399.1 Cytochrome c556 [Andreprevotia lacus DSM 23236]
MRLPVLLLLAIVTLSACQRVDPNSPQGKRQASMKQILHLSETLSGMARGRQPYVAADFSRTAQLLQQAARTPWQHFPEYTAAKPLDADAARAFNKAASDFETATDQLNKAAASGRVDDVRAPMWRVEDSCSACHRVFRPQ